MRALRLLLLLLIGLAPLAPASAAPRGPMPCHAPFATGDDAAARADAMPGPHATPHHRPAPAAACGAACLGCATELPRPAALVAPAPHAGLPYAAARPRALPGLAPRATSPPPRA